MTAAIDAGFVVALILIARLATLYHASLRERRHTDPLTGLLNLQGFETVVAAHLKRDLPFSLICLDLDGFRAQNEAHGYAAGDILLKQIAPRIRRFLRPGDTLARLSGDRFLVLLRGHDAGGEIAGRILKAVNATAGVSQCPTHATGFSELLRMAENALRHAKADARGTALHYLPSMASAGSRGAEITGLIQSALTNQNLRLVYQPVVTAEGEIARMEALVRIDDPVLGRVPPIEFIGVAEHTGLIHEVGAWVLRQACEQVRDWHAAGFRTRITVSISPIQLASDGLTARVLHELADCGLDKSVLTLHITGPVEYVSQVERLRMAGIRVSTQFAEGVETSFDEIRVKAPFKVTRRRRGLTVVAQGIETPEQLDRAHAAGCHLFQGYQIAPPLEPGDATEILRSGLFVHNAGQR